MKNIIGLFLASLLFCAPAFATAVGDWRFLQVGSGSTVVDYDITPPSSSAFMVLDAGVSSPRMALVGNGLVYTPSAPPGIEAHLDLADSATLKSLIFSGSSLNYIAGDGSEIAFPNALSAFGNDAGFITSSELMIYQTSAEAYNAFVQRSFVLNGYDMGGISITLTQDDIGDGTTNKSFTSTMSTKLSGIDDGATANQTDAYLLARANHTGTQLASTISNFTATAASAAPVQSVAGKTGSVTLAAGDIASGAFTDARIAQSNVTQHQAALSIATSQLTGTKTNTFISDFSTAARSAISVTGDGSYNSTTGVITINNPGTATLNHPSRALNSCFQISSTKDADFHYSVDVVAALVLGGGTATITSYTNSGCTTGAQAERDGTVTAPVGGTTSINLDGRLTAGLWAKITVANTGLGATSSIRAVQQEIVLP